MTNPSLDARSSSVECLGSLVVRPSSNGGVVLQQQMNQPIPPSKKSSKMFVNKEKDHAFIWIFKFAPRKKIGMLLLSLASFGAMLWILYIAKACPVCYLPVEEAIALMPKSPSYSPVLQNLTFVHDESFTKSEFGGSDFGGYPTLKQRHDSYDIRESMSVHCGFVRGDRPGRRSGYDIADSDLLLMDMCHGVVVSSAIFGAYDLIQQPKNISETAKQNVCFFMFIDEETEKFLRNSSHLDDSKKIGLWRVVVIYNLPYTDPRRNGKVPKLLSHRLFPNARYSIWLDGKLMLMVDPYQILERFLWRENASFAISRHYKRFDVFLEAEANKAAGKYDNSSIDFQIEFYKREGLTPYSAAKLPIRSDDIQRLLN